MARDFERHLAGEPVEARPLSLTYQVGRFLRQNRLATAAAAITLVGVIVRGTGTVWGLIQAHAAATSERDRADAESTGRQRAERAEAYATVQERKARHELAVATAVREFLQDDVIRQACSLAQAERRQAPNPQLTLREALDRAAERWGRGSRTGPPSRPASVAPSAWPTVTSISPRRPSPSWKSRPNA